MKEAQLHENILEIYRVTFTAFLSEIAKTFPDELIEKEFFTLFMMVSENFCISCFANVEKNFGLSKKGMNKLVEEFCRVITKRMMNQDYSPHLPH